MESGSGQQQLQLQQQKMVVMLPVAGVWRSMLAISIVLVLCATLELTVNILATVCESLTATGPGYIFAICFVLNGVLGILTAKIKHKILVISCLIVSIATVCATICVAVYFCYIITVGVLYDAVVPKSILPFSFGKSKVTTEKPPNPNDLNCRNKYVARLEFYGPFYVAIFGYALSVALIVLCSVIQSARCCHRNALSSDCPKENCEETAKDKLQIEDRPS